MTRQEDRGPQCELIEEVGGFAHARCTPGQVVDYLNQLAREGQSPGSVFPRRQSSKYIYILAPGNKDLLAAVGRLPLPGR